MRFKGQAFETMMLVISVIVALAILGVLLNILGSINFGVGNPADVMHEGLKTVQSKGFGITPAKKAVFEKGLLILKKSVLQADIPVSDAELAFNCKGTVCDDSKLKVATDSTGKGSSIESKSRIEAQIVVCGDDTKIAPAFKYCVGVGRNEQDARDACIDKTDGCDIS